MQAKTWWRASAARTRRCTAPSRRAATASSCTSCRAVLDRKRAPRERRHAFPGWRGLRRCGTLQPMRGRTIIAALAMACGLGLANAQALLVDVDAATPPFMFAREGRAVGVY